MLEGIRSISTGSMLRMRAIAGQALIEALRLRLAWLFGAVGMMLVLTGRWLRDFNFGATELKFLADFGLGAIGLVGSVLAAVAMAHLFFNEVAQGSIGCVLTRPVRRWEYVAGKLVGVMALLALFVGALGLLLAAVIAGRGWQIGAAFVPLAVFLQACALVWLKLTLGAAMTLLVCSYARSALFASCGGLMLTVVAHLRSFTEASGWRGLLRLWPNLALYDPAPVLQGGGLAPADLAGLAGYWMVFIVLFWGLAAYVFQHREF